MKELALNLCLPDFTALALSSMDAKGTPGLGLRQEGIKRGPRPPDALNFCLKFHSCPCLFPHWNHRSGSREPDRGQYGWQVQLGQAVERIRASNSFLAELRPTLTALWWGGLNVSHINVSFSFHLEHPPFQNSPPLSLQETCLFS